MDDEGEPDLKWVGLVCFELLVIWKLHVDRFHADLSGILLVEADHCDGRLLV